MPSVGLRATDGYLLNLRTYATKSPSIVIFFAGPSLRGAKRAVGDFMATTLAEAYPRLQRAGIGLIAVTTDSEAQQAAYVKELQLPYLLYSRRASHRGRGAGHPDPQRARQRQRRAHRLRPLGRRRILDLVPRAEPRGLVARLVEAISPPS